MLRWICAVALLCLSCAEFPDDGSGDGSGDGSVEAMDNGVADLGVIDAAARPDSPSLDATMDGRLPPDAGSTDVPDLGSVELDGAEDDGPSPDVVPVDVPDHGSVDIDVPALEPDVPEPCPAPPAAECPGGASTCGPLRERGAWQETDLLGAGAAPDEVDGWLTSAAPAGLSRVLEAPVRIGAARLEFSVRWVEGAAVAVGLFTGEGGPGAAIFVQTRDGGPRLRLQSMPEADILVDAPEAAVLGDGCPHRVGATHLEGAWALTIDDAEVARVASPDVDIDRVAIFTVGGGALRDLSLVVDDDGDGIPRAADNCPDLANADQADPNGDGVGLACQDGDGDGVEDPVDACPRLPDGELPPGRACAPDLPLLLHGRLTEVEGETWAFEPQRALRFRALAPEGLRTMAAAPEPGGTSIAYGTDDGRVHVHAPGAVHDGREWPGERPQWLTDNRVLVHRPGDATLCAMPLDPLQADPVCVDLCPGGHGVASNDGALVAVLCQDDFETWVELYDERLARADGGAPTRVATPPDIVARARPDDAGLHVLIAGEDDVSEYSVGAGALTQRWDAPALTALYAPGDASVVILRVGGTVELHGRDQGEPARWFHQRRAGADTFGWWQRPEGAREIRDFDGDGLANEDDPCPRIPNLAAPEVRELHRFPAPNGGGWLSGVRWTGQEFAVAADGDALDLLRFDRDGARLAEPIRLDTGDGRPRGADIVWDGIAVAAAWHNENGEGNEVRFRRFGIDGRPQRDLALLQANVDLPSGPVAVARNDTGFGVAWCTRSDLFYHRIIDELGHLADAEARRTQGHERWIASGPFLAGRDGRFLGMWNASNFMDRPTPRRVRLDADGTHLDANPPRVFDRDGDVFGLVATPEGFAAYWGIQFGSPQFVSLYDPEGVETRHGIPSVQGGAAFASDGDGFLRAWLRDGAAHIQRHRVVDDAMVHDPPFMVGRVGAGATGIRVAAHEDTTALVWLEPVGDGWSVKTFVGPLGCDLP